MKLEELLGEELYSKVQEKIDAANDGQEDKLKHIRYADLSEGGYVAKGKYDDLETDLTGKTTELAKANELIEQLKKEAGKDTALQEKITTYESEIAQLKAENLQLKTDNALKFALSEAGAVDMDYLTFKAKERGAIELDDKGQIKGKVSLINSLKNEHPKMFEGENANRKVLEIGLPKGDTDKTVTKEQFSSMGYAERLQLKKDYPETYENLMKG